MSVKQVNLAHSIENKNENESVLPLFNVVLEWFGLVWFCHAKLSCMGVRNECAYRLIKRNERRKKKPVDETQKYKPTFFSVPLSLQMNCQ